MTVPCCPRCGDQTLWGIARNRQGELGGFCRLCKHTWPIVERNVFRGGLSALSDGNVKPDAAVTADAEGVGPKNHKEATK